MKIGTLMIDMAADVARLSADMNRATGIVDAASAKMSAAANMAKGALAGIAAGFTVAAFAGVIKGAIDSAAKLHDLAIQSSTTVEALSGLAAVGKFSDQTADSIAGAMNKLTRNLASTTEESRGAGLAIQALGLSVSQFKNLRPEDQMLAVAKALDGFADSADKSAVMMALYGKEGAKMLPFMQDLAVAGDLAAKVTTEQAAAADNLSDNWLKLQTSGDAWKKELALGMIPTLDQAVQALLGVTNGSGGLREEVKRLAADGSIAAWTRQAVTGASYVIDAFEGVIRVVKSVGLAIGGALAVGIDGAQSIANAYNRIKSGDLVGAWNEMTGAAARAKTVVKEVGNDLDKMWTAPSRGQQFRAAMDKLGASVGAAGAEAARAKPKLDFQNVLNNAAKGAKDSESAFNSLIKRLQEHLDASKQEVAMGRELTDVEKLEVKTKTDVALAGKKLTDIQRAAILTKLEEVKAAALQVQIQRSQIAQAKELAEARQAQRRADEQAIHAFFETQQAEQATALRTTRERIQSIDDENAAMDLSIKANISLAEAVQRVTIARLKEKQARFHEGSEGWNDLQQQIDLANQLSEAISGAETRRRNNDMWDGFMNAAHGAFINIENGFESTVKQLWKSIKTGLLDLMWNAFAKPIMLNLRASLMGIGGGLTGTGAMAGGAGGGGGSLLNIGSSLFGAGGMAGSLMAGAGWLTGAASFGGIMGAAGSLIGTGTIAGIGSGLTMGLGAVAPVLLPLLALVGSGAFSRKHEQHNLQGTFGGASGFEGKWHDYYRGGLFSSSRTDDTDIDSTTLKALRDAWKAQEAAVTDYAQTLGLATDKISGFTYTVNLKLKDLGDPNAEGYMAKVMQRVTEALAAGSDELAQQILGTWTETTETVKQTIWTLIGGDAGWANVTTESTQTTRTYAPSEYQREGEKAIDTLARLATSLKTVNGVFDTLGLTMMETSLAGGDLASKLVDQFGGKDAFAALTSSYYDAYYSDAEKHATLQRQLTEQMAKLGQTLPTTRDEFRALIEAQDLSTDAGQKMFAALMALNPAFAQLTETAQAASPAVQSAADLLKRQNELLADQARLQADLMAARGDTTGAAAARRALDTEGYSDAERAIYDANQALSEQIELEKQRLELLRQQQAIQADLMAARGDSAGAQALRRELATVGFSDTAKAIYDANTALTAQIDLEKQRLDLLRQQQSIQADLMETAGDIAGAQALRRELATVGFSEAALAIYDANQALRDQIAAIQQFSGIVGGIGNSLASLIQDGLLGNLSAADLGGRMADVVIGGVYNAMASGFSQQITGLLMNGLVTPMVQAALVGTSVSEAVSRAAIDKMMAQATAVAQALGAVLSDPAFRAAMAQVEGIMSGLAAAMAPAQAYYVNWDTRQQEAQRAAQEAQRLADQQAQEAQRLAQQAAQEAQRAADEEARRQQGIMNERMGLTKQLLQLEGNTVLLRQIELEALDPSNRALQQRIWAIEDETAAAEKYKSALKDAQDFLGGFTKNIEEFIFKVSHAQADAQQSYQMAAAKFTAQMTLARGGDRDAMNGITGYADTLIGSIRRESATGAEANLRIARVLGQLASLPKQVSAEQLIVDAIVNANTSLETVLSTNFASLDANVDGLLTAGELAASGLATNTQISALMARVDANGDGMISKQELANSRLQTLATAQGTTNTNLGNVTSAQNSTNSWLSQIQMADVGYSLSNVNAINAGAGATVAAINKTNADLGVALVRNYDQAPVVAQFSSDSPLFSIFAAINETNAWLYHIHGLETASIRFWQAMLNNSAPVTVRSENRTPANGTVFADGGYTGPGAKWEPAGVVHKGEVVWSQADVARWGGPGIVDALRQGAPGYADGGPVAVRVPQIYVPPVGRSNEETQALLREVLAELRAQRSDDRARHNSLAEPLQRMDRRGAKWDRDGLPAERTNEAIA